MPVGADPHEFAASARQAAELRAAAVVVANGLGLEAGLEDVLSAAEEDGAEVVRVGEMLEPLTYPAAGSRHSLEPHVWMDPVRIERAVDIVATALHEFAGVDVTAPAEAYRGELKALDREIGRLVGQVPPDRRMLVTNHFALGYFAARYGFELLGTVIPAATTEAQISTAQFAALADLIEREHVTVIFGSTTEPTKLAESLAGEVGWDIRVVELYTESLGAEGSGATSYVDMMRTDARLIVENLSRGS